jgi:hypothetical protein
MIGPLKPLLHRSGVRAYINSHQHNQARIVVVGVHHLRRELATGPVVTPLPGQFAGDHHGFMTMRPPADGPGFSSIDDAGSTLYQDSNPARRVADQRPRILERALWRMHRQHDCARMCTIKHNGRACPQAQP